MTPHPAARHIPRQAGLPDAIHDAPRLDPLIAAAYQAAWEATMKTEIDQKALHRAMDAYGYEDPNMAINEGLHAILRLDFARKLEAMGGKYPEIKESFDKEHGETAESLYNKSVEEFSKLGGKHPEVAQEFYGDLYDSEDRASRV